jgi:tRNA (cytidine/uridine-2'-O-)-methyltransferase
MAEGCLQRHVVLVAPEIHWNTGNIGRTCLGVGAQLHLIKPLGFSLQSREVKRAGLDYWPRVRLKVWDELESCLAELAPQPQDVAVFSKNGLEPVWSIPKAERLVLVFGSETRGLPPAFLRRHHKHTYHIPISANIRSLNLSTAVGIALYESLRGLPAFHAWPANHQTRDESVPL